MKITLPEKSASQIIELFAQILITFNDFSPGPQNALILLPVKRKQYQLYNTPNHIFPQIVSNYVSRIEQTAGEE